MTDLQVDPKDFVKPIPQELARQLARGAMRTAARWMAYIKPGDKAAAIHAQFQVWFLTTGNNIVKLSPDSLLENIDSPDEPAAPRVDEEGIAMDT